MGWLFLSYVKANHSENLTQIYLAGIFFSHIMCHDKAVIGDEIVARSQCKLPHYNQDKKNKLPVE